MFPGSTLSDHCLRYENIPQIKLIVVLGELGGMDEYSLVDALKEGRITKPVVAWVSGTCATLFKSEVQFGHAGAKSGGQAESAQARSTIALLPVSVTAHLATACTVGNKHEAEHGVHARESNPLLIQLKDAFTDLRVGIQAQRFRASRTTCSHNASRSTRCSIY